MNMKEIKNMKKLSILFISSLIGTAGLMTSCSEDYPGPDPVDVTANYSNKYLSKSNLTLTYDGDEMTGKAVDFSTVKGETANVDRKSTRLNSSHPSSSRMPSSA